jgi:hypothetical protein
MSTVINPDKSVVKKAKKLIAKNAGFCPIQLDMGIKYNCKDCACTEFEISNDDICPIGMYIKNKENI